MYRSAQDESKFATDRFLWKIKESQQFVTI